MLTEDEREWILCGMAWIGLRRWLCGSVAGDQARAWLQDEMDLRFGAKTAARHLTPDMERLGGEMQCLMARAASPAGQTLPE